NATALDRCLPHAGMDGPAAPGDVARQPDVDRQQTRDARRLHMPGVRRGRIRHRVDLMLPACLDRTITTGATAAWSRCALCSRLLRAGPCPMPRRRRQRHFAFSILVTVNWPLTRSPSNLILSPALTCLSIAGSWARHAIVIPSSMSNFLIGPCLIVILPAASST